MSREYYAMNEGVTSQMIFEPDAFRVSFEELDRKIRNLQNELFTTSSANNVRPEAFDSFPINNVPPVTKVQIRPNFQDYLPRPATADHNPGKENQSVNKTRKPAPREAPSKIPESHVKIQNLASPSVKSPTFVPPIPTNPSDRGEKAVSDIKAKLKRIFTFYTSFGDRINTSLLRSNKFHKMMIDAGIEDASLTQKQLDLLFVKATHHKANMDFQSFLDLLPRIALSRFPSVSQEGDATLKLLNMHLLPLYDKLYTHATPFPETLNIIDILDEPSHRILVHVSQVLLKLWQVYFPWELQSFKDTKTRSYNTLPAFLRDFDICPALLTKSLAHSLTDHVFNDEQPQILPPTLPADSGHSFTYHRFVAYLTLAAALGYSPAHNPSLRPQTNYSLSEKLVFLFERMELSQGFLNLEKKTHQPHHSGMSLLISPEFLLKMKIFNGPDQEVEEAPTVRSRNQSINSAVRRTSSRAKSTVSTSMNISREEPSPMASDNLLDPRYIEALKRVFEAYCTLGDPTNTKYLKSGKFARLLREAGLLKVTNNISLTKDEIEESGLILPIHVDFIFVKITSGGKKLMYFRDFVKALEAIAERLIAGGAYGDMTVQEALNKLVEGYILPLLSEPGGCGMKEEQRLAEEENVKFLLGLLRNPDIVELLGLVHKTMVRFYRAYTNPAGLMNLEGFERFCREFEVFPGLISKSKVHRLFNAMASLNQRDLDPFEMQQNGGPKRNWESNLTLDQHSFVETLAVLSFEITYSDPQPSNLERICFFLEKLNQTQGPRKVFMSLGMIVTPEIANIDLLSGIRRRYPHIFDNSIRAFEDAKSQNNRHLSFDEIMKTKL
eukprot:TRINITY_DN2238_c0_g1_i4.p1 TRINITY_DN2238_c0_g1~~TRINITY_DN2238_c0_g1_i4.p1  ORF type:complete len:837 (-),score=175.80 TRINITY_DN2238_c0_g1_i4:158-2668(-)